MVLVWSSVSSMDVLAADLDGERALAGFNLAEKADAKVSVTMDKLGRLA